LRAFVNRASVDSSSWEKGLAGRCVKMARASRGSSVHYSRLVVYRRDGSRKIRRAPASRGGRGSVCAVRRALASEWPKRTVARCGVGVRAQADPRCSARDAMAKLVALSRNTDQGVLQMRECVGANETCTRSESEGRALGPPRRCQSTCPRARRRSIGRSGRSYANGSEFERIWSDPKDRDLCVRRLKPGESPVEGRRDVDVQIALVTCAKGRKTNRTV